jgi:hypothetical protein
MMYHINIMISRTHDKAHPRSRRIEDWFERAAVGASLLCLVHCLALPLLLAALPALSRFLAIPEGFHVGLLFFAVPASGIALVAGRARHGGTRPLLWGIAGLSFLAIAALALAETRWETPVTVGGSLILAAAHISNWRLRHRTGLSHHP